MHRLSDLGRRHLSDRPVRSLLVGLSISLAVAVLLGVATGTSTLRPGLDELGATVGSKADVVVAPRGPYGSRLPAGALADIERLDGIARAVPVLGTVAPITPANREVQSWVTAVVSVDAGDADAVGARAGEGRLPTDADEVAIDRHQSEALGLGVGDELLLGPERLSLEVVGLLDRGALTQSGDGDLVLGVPALAARLGSSTDPSQIVVVLDEGVDASTWVARHRDAVPAVRLEDIAGLRAPLEELFDGVLAALSGVSMLGLVLAGYLIHLALSSSIAQRTRTYGTLLALGATRRQIRSTVLAEVLWLGVVSVAVGVAIGLGLARVISSVVANTFEIADHGLVVRPLDVLICAGSGLVCAVVSALVPARSAVRLAPIAAIRSDAPPPAPSSWVTIAGVVTLALAAGLVAYGSQELGVFGTGATLLGIGMVLPALLPRLAALVGPLVRRGSPGMGEVAVAHIVKERSRSALTAGLLVGVLGVALLSGSVYGTLEPQFRRYMELQFGSDLLVDSGLGLADGALPEDYAERVAAIDGVAAVAPLWHASTAVTGVDESRFLTVIDPATYFGPSGFLFVDGSEAAVQAALGHGGVVVPALLADEQGWELGSSVELVVGSTRATFEVAGTYLSFGDAFTRAVVVGRDDAVGRLALPLAGPNDLRIDVADGVDPSSVAAQLPPAGGDVVTRVRLGTDSVQDALDQFNAVFSIFIVLEVLAAVIGLLGLANTMAISVMERTREIGVLRALGTRVREVRRMVIVEGLVLVAVAMVLGVGVSWILSRDAADTSGVLLGFKGTAVYPWALVPVLAVLAVVASIAASLLPARRAARIDPCEALRLE